jgi:hypothetical protein
MKVLFNHSDRKNPENDVMIVERDDYSGYVITDEGASEYHIANDELVTTHYISEVHRKIIMHSYNS